MSIANAINNARNKISRAYNALESKGAQIPDVKDLQHLPDAISSVSEFSREFANWKYSGEGGFLGLTGTWVSGSYPDQPTFVNVPYTNYTYLTNTTFTSGTNNSSTLLGGVECNNVPFTNAIGAFQGCSRLSYAYNVYMPNYHEILPMAYDNASNMFRGCSFLVHAQISAPGTRNAQSMFYGCSNCWDIVLQGSNISNLYHTFHGVNSGYYPEGGGHYLNVTISSPVVTDTNNTFNSFDSTQRKNVFIPFRYSNNVYTSTFNSFKGAQYMGTSGNSTSSYISPRYNETTNFYLYDLNEHPLIFGGEYRIVNKSVEGSAIEVTTKSRGYYSSIKEVAYYKEFPDSAEETSFTITNLSSTFESCTDFKGNLRILSENIENAAHCFANTYLSKHVYIPYEYNNGTKTKTFNAFVNAGYLFSNGESTHLWATTMHDLNEQ